MSSVVIRPVADVPTDAVVRFFADIPAGDRTFFKETVTGADTVETWRSDGDSDRFVAWDGDAVLGYVAVVPGVGWSRHVGEVRLVVAAAARGRGLGRRLARHVVAHALERGLDKLVVEVVSDQVATIGLFTGIGFVPEALLEDHVRDDRGRVMDLIVLAHRGADSLAVLAATGISEENA